MVYSSANANLISIKDKLSAAQINKDEKQEFWTDSNGRQMIRRLQDTRFSFDLNGGEKDEPVTSNYYPINSGIPIPSFLFKIKISKTSQHIW